MKSKPGLNGFVSNVCFDMVLKCVLLQLSTVAWKVKLSKTKFKRYNTVFAAVAQLDRVLGYEPRGRGFKSCQPHQ